MNVKSSYLKTAAYLMFVLASECLLAFGVYVFYSLFSMLYFGESARSFAYSRQNEIIFYSIVVGVPFAYNLILAWKANKADNKIKAIGFLFVTAIYLFLIISTAGIFQI